MSVRQQIGTRRPAHATEAESGFMLVFAVVMVALVLIAMAVAAPVIAKQLRRDKEVESEHRAEQYVRAIRLYYRKYKTYPPSIKALENTNNVRYLRKDYIDPLTGKNNWRIIHVGQNKTRVKGFFGQPLGGLNTTGIGGSMSGGLMGAASPIGGGSSTIGSTSALSAGFLGSTTGVDTDNTSNPTATAGTSSFGTSGIGTTGSGTTGSTGTASAESGDGTGSIGPIMGVGSSKTGTSILNPNGQTTYESWEFLYDPKIELLYQQSNILGGGGITSQPASSLTDAASGQSTNGSGSLNSSGSTNNGSTGTGTPVTQGSPDNLF